MKELIKLPYEKVDFRFVSDHYDIHLNGTCIFEKQLCEFKTEWDRVNDMPANVVIYQLSFVEKLKWKWRQKTFEIFVGDHWSYGTKKKKGFMKKGKVGQFFMDLYYKLQ